MAKLRFIKGAITGKLGEFVGSSWKGINYIKTWTPPSNPRTPNQISVRIVFRNLAWFASALFKAGLFDLIPEQRRMTARNTVLKANAPMFTNKTFLLPNISIAPENFQPVLTDMGSEAIWNRTMKRVQVKTGHQFLPEYLEKGVKLHTFIYDTATRKVLGLKTFTNAGSTNDITVPDVGFATNTAIAIAFFTQEAGGKKYISRTYAIPITEE